MSTETQYRPLGESFKADGFNFQLCARKGVIALFAKTKPEYGNPAARQPGWIPFISYEVVTIQLREAGEIKGSIIPAREALPSSERWGEQAWTYADWDAALNRFLAKAESQPGATDWIWVKNPNLPPPHAWVLDRTRWESFNRRPEQP